MKILILLLSVSLMSASQFCVTTSFVPEVNDLEMTLLNDNYNIYDDQDPIDYYLHIHNPQNNTKDFQKIRYDVLRQYIQAMSQRPLLKRNTAWRLQEKERNDLEVQLSAIDMYVQKALELQKKLHTLPCKKLKKSDVLAMEYISCIQHIHKTEKNINTFFKTKRQINRGFLVEDIFVDPIYNNDLSIVSWLSSLVSGK